MDDPNGAWIFLSHSTKDWTEVRRVRNLLEEKGHRPLVFFLKCLSEHGELIDLIKREIEARTWFLLCDSENAQRSSYVQEEVTYIKGLPGKYYEEIDLNEGVTTQVERVDRLCKRIAVYLSYSHKDVAYARRIQEALVRKDYWVWCDQTMPAGANFSQELQKRLDPAIERGFVLFLLSPNYWESGWCMDELRYALSKGDGSGRANIIPILLGGPQMSQNQLPISLELSLAGIQLVDFSCGDFDGNISALVDDLKSRDMDWGKGGPFPPNVPFCPFSQIGNPPRNT